MGNLLACMTLGETACILMRTGESAAEEDACDANLWWGWAAHWC
jgi:hypothetical protein